jgi:hypothetical protein
MYHLLKARNNSLSELKSPITGDQTVLLVGNQQTLIRSHNYFTKAIILNNRIKKRETIVHLNYSTFRIKL